MTDMMQGHGAHQLLARQMLCASGCLEEVKSHMPPDHGVCSSTADAGRCHAMRWLPHEGTAAKEHPVVRKPRAARILFRVCCSLHPWRTPALSMAAAAFAARCCTVDNNAMRVQISPAATS